MSKAQPITVTVSYHSYGGYRFEINADVPIGKVIFSCQVTAETRSTALSLAVDKALERLHINAAQATLYKAAIQKGRTSVSLATS